MANEKLSVEEVEQSFRESLQDVITIAGKLSGYCKTVDELVGMLELAKENTAQLRLIMSLMTAGKR